MLQSSQAAQNNAVEIRKMTTKKILVVDDESTIRDVVAACLHKLGGWETLTASSGQEGLHLATTEQPDVIVLDMMMPEMDGFVFLQYLRANSITQAIPVIFLTASIYYPDSHLLTQLGVVSVISKPFRAVDLVHQIAQVMEW